MSGLFGPVPEEHEHHEGEDELLGRRAERRQRQKVKKRKQRRRWMTTSLVVLGLAAVAAAAYFIVVPMLTDDGGPQAVTDYPGPGTGSVQVTIHPGDSGSAIAATLAENDVVATEDAFIDAYRNNPNSTKIQAGTYQMRKEMNAAAAVEWLLNPKNQVTSKILVKEGWRSWEIYQAISDATGFSVEEIEAAAGDSAAIGLPDVAKGDPEGWLFPATYTVSPDDTPGDILSQMVDKTISVLDSLGVPTDQREEVLTKASIVERETRRSEDRAKAARVIDNRLAAGRKLEMDSTIAYITRASRVDTTGDERAIDDLHNTYLYPGLPSGPICSPGTDAIEAVLNPADGTWMYFVTTNLCTGETEFANTEEEFAALREKYQQSGTEGCSSASATTGG